MATSARFFQIALGLETVQASTTTILGSGTEGTVGARRVLTHPDAENFPSLVYYRNPDRDINIDNDVLFGPLNQVFMTESTTQVVRHTRGISDVIVTEQWVGGRGRASMPTSFFRLLYEYFVNPPPPVPDAQTYITWQPRDKNTETYNVELVSLEAGRGGLNSEFEVPNITESGGSVLARAIDGVDPGVETGLMDVPVTLTMRIVSKVVEA